MVCNRLTGAKIYSGLEYGLAVFCIRLERGRFFASEGFLTSGIIDSKASEGFLTSGISDSKASEGFLTSGISDSKASEGFLSSGISDSARRKAS